MGPGVGSSGQACGLEESVALEVSEKLESVGMKELEEWEAVAELGTDVGTGGPSPGDEWIAKAEWRQRSLRLGLGLLSGVCVCTEGIG